MRQLTAWLLVLCVLLTPAAVFGEDVPPTEEASVSAELPLGTDLPAPTESPAAEEPPVPEESPASEETPVSEGAPENPETTGDEGSPAFSVCSEEPDEATLVKQAIQKILKQCIREGMTEAQKALSVNDWMCTHFQYSMEYGSGAHNYAYILLYGKGVCQAYADAYGEVMRAAGLTCYTVTSYEMRHAWNMIQIDGAWYHVDVTWNDRYDDNDPPVLGYAGHEYLLCSESAMQSGNPPHYGVQNAPVGASASSTLYDNAFWKDVDCPVSIGEDAYYYALDKGDGTASLIRRPFDTDTSTVVRTVSSQKPSPYSGENVRVGVAEYAGRLYYNTPTEIRSCKTDGSDDRLEQSPQLSYASYFISGLYSEGSTLYYGIGNRPEQADVVGSFILPLLYPVTSVTLPEDFTLSPGESGTLTATVLPENASDPTLRWSSTDPAVLSVDPVSGAYTALHSGTAQIVAAAVDGSDVTGICTVQVLAPLRSLRINGEKNVYVGGGVQLTVEGLDTEGNSRDVTASVQWKASNPAVATVEAGLVTGLQKGRVTLTCTQGGKTASFSMNVLRLTDGVTISGSNLTITRDRGKLQLKAVCTPSDAANKAVLWSVENGTGIATVDSRGLLTAVRDGEVVVTAVAADGSGASDTAVVTLSGQTSYGITYGPRLSANALTLEIKSLLGTEITLLPRGRDNVTAAVLSDDRFSLIREDGTDCWRLTAAPGSSLKTGRYSMTLRVTTSAEGETFSYALTVTLRDTTPRITLRVGRVDLFDRTVPTTLTLTSTSGKVTLLSLEDDPAKPGFADSFSLTDGSLYLRPETSGPVLRGFLRVQVEGYEPQLVRCSLSSSSAAPRLATSTASFTLARDGASHAVCFTVYSTSDRTRTPLVPTEVALETDRRTGLAYNAGQLTVSSLPDGSVILTPTSEWLAAQTRTTSLRARITVRCQGWSQAVPVAVTISLRTDTPTVRLSSPSVALNCGLRGETARVSLISSQQNLPVVGAEILPAASNRDDAVSLHWEDGMLSASLTDAPTGSSYRFSILPSFGENLNGRALTLTVQITRSAPTLTLTPRSGRINVCDRENTVQPYALRLTNTADTVSSVTLDPVSAGLLESEYREGVLTLRLRPDAPYTNGQRYAVTITAHLAGSGTEVSRIITVQPVCTLPRVSFSSAGLTLWQGVDASRNVLRIPLTLSLGALSDAELVPNRNTPAAFSSGFDASSNLLTVALDGEASIKAGRYTLRFSLCPEGAPAGSVVTINVPITVK